MTNFAGIAALIAALVVWDVTPAPGAARPPQRFEVQNPQGGGAPAQPG